MKIQTHQKMIAAAVTSNEIIRRQRTIRKMEAPLIGEFNGLNIPGIRKI